MSKSIFVSCVYEDAQFITNLEKWAYKGLLGENVKITSETIDNRQHGYVAILNHLRPMINGASSVLVLIGRDTHNHDWIRAEVELSNSYHKQLIVARIPNTNGGIPSILVNRNVIAFHPDSIKKALL